ncbi:MAG TPA: cupredoxin family copper-binding protein [Pseudonocardiaceae bacterium]|nr:cupredoxin family copper-binding protein [Pseudonocardiaceae bacterium]
MLVVKARRLLLVLAVLVPSLLFAVPAPSAYAAGHAITMANYAFSPASATITAGESVTWTNTDQAPHDVTTTSAPVAIHSPTLSTGQSWTYTFSTPGTYSYICSIHPDMHATLVVEPAAPVTTAAAVPPPVTRRQPVPTARTAPAGPVATSQAAAPATTGAAAAAPDTSMAMPSGQQQQPATAAAGATSGQGQGINPLLLVAGLVAAVATLCLLLIGSKPEPSR